MARKGLAVIQAAGLVDVEYRVKVEGTPWENTNIFTRKGAKNCVDAQTQAQEMADRHGVEVRWNILGLQQGHYAQPGGGK